MPKLSVSISRVLVDGLNFVILSADFLLNFDGLSQTFVLNMSSLSVVFSGLGE